MSKPKTQQPPTSDEEDFEEDDEEFDSEEMSFEEGDFEESDEEVDDENSAENVVNEYLAAEDSEKFKKDFGLATSQVMNFLLQPDEDDFETKVPEGEEERQAFVKKFVEEKLCPVGLNAIPDGKLEERLAPVLNRAMREGNTDSGSHCVSTFGEEASKLLTITAACIELHKNKTIDDAQAKKATKIADVAKSLTPAAVMTDILTLYTMMFQFDMWVMDNENEDDEFVLPMKCLNTMAQQMLKGFDDAELGLVGSCSRNSIKFALAHGTSIFAVAAEDRDVGEEGINVFAPDADLWNERVAVVKGGSAGGAKRKGGASPSGNPAKKGKK